MKLSHSQQMSSSYFTALLIGAWLLGLAGESLYAPAMPKMVAQLSTSSALIKQTITFFILGKSLSMIICSPIAEAFGRRQFILFGLSLFVIGGLGCVFSQNINMLLISRLLQGLGCSITVLMGRAIVNDLFESRRAAKVFSYIFMGNAISIFALPAIGGYLVVYFDWRAIFLILTIYGTIIFSLVWWLLPQTNQIISLNSLKPKVILSNYKTVVSNAHFWGFLLCVAFMMAGEKAYTTTSAFLFINTVGLSAITYGYLTSAMWGAHLIGAFFAGWLAVRSGIDRVIIVGMAMVALPGLIMLIMVLGHWDNIDIFTIMMFIYMAGSGFIVVSAAVGIVRPFPNLIGFATAFAMALEFVIATIMSYVISQSSSASVFPVETIVGIMGVLVFCAWLFFLKFPRAAALQGSLGGL